MECFAEIRRLSHVKTPERSGAFGSVDPHDGEAMPVFKPPRFKFH
jgi:hypothetical protein